MNDTAATAFPTAPEDYREVSLHRLPQDAATLLHAILDQPAFGVAVVEGATGRFVRVNQRFSDMVGYEPGELEQREFHAITHPEDLPRDLENVRRLMAGLTRGYTRMKRYLRKEGRVIWVNLTVSPLWQPGEAPNYILAMVEDITESKRAEEALRRNREWLHSIFRAAPVGIGVVKDRVLVEVNAQITAMTGYDTQELVGVSARLLYPSQEEFEYVGREKYRQIAEQGTGTVETRWRRKDGGLIDVLLSSTPLDPEDPSQGVTFTALDITARQRAEQALRESEQRYRQLFNGITDLVFLHEVTDDDLPGRFLAVNDAACQRLGYTREEFMQLTPRDIDALESEVDVRPVVAQLKRGERLLFEQIHRTKDGRRIPVEINVQGFEMQGRIVVLSVVRDISERKQAERERVRLEEQFRQAQKMESIGRLAGGVAHDFNNMLQAILGNASFALEILPPDSRARDNLEEIRRSGERSADLTRQLLAFARKQTIAPKVLDLNDTVAGMLKMLRRLIGEDIDLVWIPGANLWPVKMDPSQVDQILVNLCVNARDAIADTGKVTIETGNVRLDEPLAATHADCLPGDYVVFAVNDNGTGMDAATQSHLFEPFFTTKSVGKGTGLGLATVFGIVKQNQGLITVHSEPGHGSTFKIYLPRAATVPAPSSPEDKARSLRGTETVLVVEDEEQILSLTRSFLQRHGYTVLGAPTAEVALTLAARHAGPVHLLVTDVVMPGLNGKELWERLRAVRPELKCLFMSGCTAEVIAHRGVLDEGVDFLQKPFLLQTLGTRVREVLEPLRAP